RHCVHWPPMTICSPRCSKGDRMSLIQFEKHLNDPHPGFRCYAAGDHEKKLRFVASVVHEVAPPLSAGQLARYFNAASIEMKDFYKKHNGLLLYRDTNERENE